ncbi:hypothetical protein TSUD_26660 [Trifolium subterraneum]|uniref:Uncharacterized protein n=1 Tax=Trifolium subterraneum TaxID=3900 RepID=A0A2Z6NAL9_TRISU|nr:hypothetical protein TSUD_26660 [Trifolium subterraneum]
MTVKKNRFILRWSRTKSQWRTKNLLFLEGESRVEKSEEAIHGRKRKETTARRD